MSRHGFRCFYKNITEFPIGAESVSHAENYFTGIGDIVPRQEITVVGDTSISMPATYLLFSDRPSARMVSVWPSAPAFTLISGYCGAPTAKVFEAGATG